MSDDRLGKEVRDQSCELPEDQCTKQNAGGVLCLRVSAWVGSDGGQGGLEQRPIDSGGWSIWSDLVASPRIPSG
jgi:hypothetical protein